MAKVSIVVVLVCVELFFCGALKVIGADDSFTDIILSRDRRQTEDVECILPPYPEHGEWKVVNGEGRPGGKLLEGSVIKFSCNFAHKLSSQSPYLICDDNWRTWTIPECEELCPPLYPSDTYELRCFDKRGTKIKCSEATDGTYLEYDCARFYETPFNYKKTLLCEDGKWNYLKPTCLPVCGKKIDDKAKPLIYGSKPNEKLEYPWVTALYQKINGSFVLVCGGSILSQTVVITAAHCVTNDYGNILPKENYVIGAGKLYSKYQASEDKHAQYMELSKIVVHPDYRAGTRRYLADIAVVVTSGEFVLNEVVQPVCFNGVDRMNLYPGNIGEVSGWGQTEDDLLSDVLRTLKIPYKHETTCAAELPSSWSERYNMRDKICAGFINESRSVCDGDSGNGLAFKSAEDRRYYIHGIVSLGLKLGDTCDIQQNTLYTKVAAYYDFVDRLLSKHAPEIKDCILPKPPKNGNWTIDKQNKNPGDAVPSSMILRVKCNEGFKLSPFKAAIECGLAHNMPTCEELCPTLKFPRFTHYQCTDTEGLNINCSEAINGDRLLYICPSGFELQTNNPIYCVKGSWGSPQPACLPLIKNCGKRVKNDTTGEEGLEYPWTVGLYKKEGNDYTYYCGGSLISNKLVLTAGQCVTDTVGDLLPVKNYIVAAGKTHVKMNDSRDVGAQYSAVWASVYHSHYKSREPGVKGDIALISVQTAFVFNSYVQPVCFRNIDNIQLKHGTSGMISGWKSKEDAEELGTLQIKYKNKTTCTVRDTFMLPSDDKICVEYVNQTISWCKDNIGKGLVIKNPDDDRYYIQGISTVVVTVGWVKPVCEDWQYVLYTSISYYYDFIDCAFSKI